MKFSIRDNNTARKKIRYNRICLKSIKIHNKKKTTDNCMDNNA